MSEPYLIAHVVRGEPAFDIAIKLQIANEEGWIIPTSGHRAYPYDTIQLNNVSKFWLDNLPAPPPSWPDHYKITERVYYEAVDEEAKEGYAPTGQGSVVNLADLLGLIHKPTTISRR